MQTRTLRVICLALCLAPGVAPKDAAGARDHAQLCDEAAHTAAVETGVPLNVLLAITRVETGRGATGMPWPWTINHAGRGLWFGTRSEAVLAAEAILTTGSANLDIGCFQLNHRWHGANFAALDDMFDPATNARYAAAFLADLYREKADWTAAVAAYHSRSEGPAAAYLIRIEAVLARLADSPAPTPVRQNSYPLLQSGGQGNGGSLVPRQTSRRPLIGAAP